MLLAPALLWYGYAATRLAKGVLHPRSVGAAPVA